MRHRNVRYYYYYIILTVIYIPRAIDRRICTSRCSQKQADLFRGPIRELQLVEPIEATGGSGRMKLNEEGGCETSMSLAGAASSNILAKAEHAAGLNFQWGGGGGGGVNDLLAGATEPASSKAADSACFRNPVKLIGQDFSFVSTFSDIKKGSAFCGSWKISRNFWFNGFQFLHVFSLIISQGVSSQSALETDAQTVHLGSHGTHCTHLFPAFLAAARAECRETVARASLAACHSDVIVTRSHGLGKRGKRQAGVWL